MTYSITLEMMPLVAQFDVRFYAMLSRSKSIGPQSIFRKIEQFACPCLITDLIETLWTGAGSGLLISMLEKLNWFHLVDLTTLVILV